jgi:hypothetical protein
MPSSTLGVLGLPGGEASWNRVMSKAGTGDVAKSPGVTARSVFKDSTIVDSSFASADTSAMDTET